jgi:hypothetical protein
MRLTGPARKCLEDELEARLQAINAEMAVVSVLQLHNPQSEVVQSRLGILRAMHDEALSALTSLWEADEHTHH